MLITKTVIMKWHSINKEWYEDKGYIFTKYRDQFEVRVEDLQEGSNAKVDIQCDGCGELLKGIVWRSYKKYVHEDGKYYCFRCGKKLYGNKKGRLTRLQKSISFYQWCYDNLFKELADYILSRWDDELNVDKNGNKLSPKDVTFSSDGFNKKGYWFKCLDYPEHPSELKSINGFVHGQKGNLDCNQCNVIATTDPKLSLFLVNEEDSFKYSRGSGVKIPMKCPDCGYKKEMGIDTLRRQGFGCNRCGDGVSYPNKIGFNFFEQLVNIQEVNNFESEKSFDWCKFIYKNKLRKGKYDFYFELDNKKYIVEMDGGWHTNDNNMNDQTKEDSQYIDNEKYRLAKENGIILIRIDCKFSNLDYIKNNILLSELDTILNLNDINWSVCDKYACKSLVKVSCDLWNEGIKNVVKISNELKLDKTTIRRYLNKGTELGWCYYDGKEESLNNYKSTSKKFSVKVICITTGEVFDSMVKASEKYNVKKCVISACCLPHGKSKSAGKHPITNEKLIWQYYSEYLQLQELKTSTSEELSIKDNSFSIPAIM